MANSIWFKAYSIEDARERCAATMVDYVGIQFLEIGDDYLKASMPVDRRTRQPIGLLHGGASVVLSETLGSVAANYCVDPEKYYGVGLEINANHVRSAFDQQGPVIGTCKPLHIGKRTHVWQTEIHNAADKLICVSRLTVAILERV